MWNDERDGLGGHLGVAVTFSAALWDAARVELKVRSVVVHVQDGDSKWDVSLR